MTCASSINQKNSDLAFTNIADDDVDNGGDDDGDDGGDADGEK